MATDHNFLIKNGLDIDGANATIVQDGNETRITSTGEIRFRPEGSSSNKVRITLNTTHISGSLDASANVDANAFRINGTTVIDASRALVSINHITTGGDINTTSGSFKINGTTVIDSNQRILAGDGAANVPYITFAADTDTGLYRPGANILGFSTAGSERMRIDSSGSATFTNEIIIPASIVHAGDSDTFFGFHTNNQWRVVTGGTERIEVRDSEIVINDGGSNYDFRVEADNDANNLFSDGGNSRIGIGTSNPLAKLAVHGPGATLAKFVANTAGEDALVRIIAANYNTEADARLFLGEGDTYGMTVEYDGNSNIGYIGMNDNVDPTGSYSKRIGMSRGGTEVFFTAGSVGIGTTSPTFYEGSGLEIERAGIATIRLQNTSGKSVEITQNSDFKIESMNSGSDIILMPTANVGIGTALPSKPLHVQFSGDHGVRIESEDNHASLYIDSHTSYAQYIRFTEENSNKYWIQSTGGNLVFRPGATSTVANQVILDANGKVGIGTSSLTNKFHVSGDTRIEGSLMAGGAAASNVPARPIHIKSSGDAAAIRIEDTTSSNQVFDIRSTQGTGLKFIDVTNASSSSRLTIDTAGQVGIGNSGAVNAKLHVEGPGGTRVQINSPDNGGAPALTSRLEMYGYEGRGVGIEIRDSFRSASNANNREWFIGSGYGQSGFNIGYASDGVNSSYAAQNKFSISTAGHASFAGNVTTSGNLTTTTINTGQGHTEVYLMNQNVRTTDSPTFADLTITGNLAITGDINSYNVTDLDVVDKTITLGVGGTASANDGGGIIVDGANAKLTWNNTNSYWQMNQKLAFNAPATTFNNALGIVWSGFDKEGTSDYSDNASIIHTTNAGGHAGSVLLITSQNDANDGIAFVTNASSKLKHNSNNIFTDAYHPNADTLTTARTIAGTSFDGSANIDISYDNLTNKPTNIANSDTVDGVHAASLLRSDATDTSSGKLSFGFQVSNLNSVSGSQGVTPFRSSYQASNRPGTGNYFTGAEYTFHDSGARAQLGFGSSGNNTIPHLYARTEGWSGSDGWHNWYLFWHSGNDGAGSGLDADTVDGVHAASFLRSDATDTASETITFSKGINVGDLSNGGITGSNYNITGVNNITMNDPGEGISFAGTSNVTLYAIDDSTDSIMNFSNATELRVNNNKVWTVSNDGPGSGLNADTLDGVEGSNYVRRDVNTTLFTGNARLAFENQSSFVRQAFYKLSLWEWDVGEQLVIDNGIFQVKSSEFQFTGGYAEFGNSTSSVSNDGGWNARLNVAGSSHARLDVKSVSDGIITTMYAHTGHGVGRVGTMSNHSLALMVNTATKATLDGGGNFTTTGNVSHAGLTMTSGTDIDQLYSVTKSITLTTSWQDTGIIFSNLATGSYIVQVKADDHSVGGQQYSEYYTGVMSWYASTTNSSNSDEIVLHRAGHASNNGDIFLRTKRTTGNTSPNLHMEIRGSTSNTGASNYVFKFRRMI